jgi:predicted ABC-type ATPase
VKLGGHDIPDEDVRRRYGRSVTNFFGSYAPLAKTWHLFDNDGAVPRLIARATRGQAQILDAEVYERISSMEGGT